MEVVGKEEITTMQVYFRSLKRIDKILGDIPSNGHNITRYNALELILDIVENKIPIKGDLDILLETDLDRKTLYNILKVHPEASEFLYEKYIKLRDMMKEICNPKNPLYLKEVSDNLSGYFQYEDIKSEASRLKSDILKLRDDISAYNEERSTLEKESNETTKALGLKKKELEELQKQVVNIHETTGLRKITDFIRSVQDTINAVLSRGQGEVYSGDSLVLNREKVMNLQSVSKLSSELEIYLKTQDFLSQNNLDETQKKLLAEIEDARYGIEAWMSKNPTKQLSQIENLIDRMCGYAGQFLGSKLTEHGYKMITDKANEAKSITSEIRTEIAMAKEAKT